MNQRSAWDDDEQTTTTEVPSAYAHRPPDADATSPHRAQGAYDPPVVYGRPGYDDPFASQRSPRPGPVGGGGLALPESLRDGALAAADVYADPFVSQRSPTAPAAMTEEQRRYEADLRRYEAEKAAYEQQQRDYEAAQAAYEAQQAAAAQAEYEQKLREYEEQKRAYEQQQRDYEAQQRAYEAQQRAAAQPAPAPRRSLPPGASTMASVERPPSIIPRPAAASSAPSVARAGTPAPAVAAVPSRSAPAPTPAPMRASVPAPSASAPSASAPAPSASAGARAAATLLGASGPSTGAQPENALLFKMAGASQPPPRPATEVSADGTGMIDLFALQRAYGSAPAVEQSSPLAPAVPVQAAAPPPAKKSPLPLILGGAVAALLLVVGLGGALTFTLFRAPAGSVQMARMQPSPVIFLATRTSLVPEPAAEEAPKAKAASAGTASHAAFTPPKPTAPRKPDKCAYCKGKLDCVIRCQSGGR